MVESLGREAWSKTVWKTLPQGVNNLRQDVSQANFTGVIVYTATPRLLL